ncbi:Tyrosine-protein phosphatase non-receptor type 21 [Saguinus oedipus]|uniref:Tyrosine-protein phosphatase non-receptor type 21 n=1 Tax=Saguinus oedipus TaxID=9490 RepID=A0ABQ9V5U5_SAGOE|nr:Tyrosine-protein phosphatase non-receptor type 21 [Saguinus oedipus]
MAWKASQASFSGPRPALAERDGLLFGHSLIGFSLFKQSPALPLFNAGVDAAFLGPLETPLLFNGGSGCWEKKMPLPFGLKLKRTRRYTVSSKSCLVARIQLLNNEFVEFTLSVESTGQESLEAVAQRLELREVTYFSLWYYNKQNQRRWVDLEKPLKKQLDKYALEPTIYFGVVFYVPSVSQLQQEITR